MISWQNRRRLVNLLLLAVAALPWGWFGMCQVRGRLIENRIGTLATVEATLRSELTSERGAAPETPATAVERPSWSLPKGPEIAATMQELEHAAAQCGVAISTIRTPASAGGRQPFEILGTGEPTELCAWLAAVERHSRLMLVESAKIVHHDATKVGFEVTLATHFAEQER